eukprot:s555_g8.t1
MAPKAKAKGKALARAPALRRPEAALVPGRRRPAAAEEGETPWKRGLVQNLREVPLEEFSHGSCLVVEEADYFGARIKFAGEVKRLEVDHGETFLHLKARGTDSEALLKAHTSQPQTLFKGHVCPDGCGRQVTGDYTLHLLTGRKGKAAGDEGRRSEELAMQDREAGRPPKETPGGKPEDQKGPSLEKQKKKKDKKEKKKDKRGRRWEASCDSRPKGGEGLIPWDRLGPKGEGEEESAEKSPEVCIQKEGTEQQQELGRVKFVDQHVPGGASGDRGGLHRGYKSEGCSGALPRSSYSRGPFCHEEVFAHHQWGGCGGLSHQADCSPLLPDHPGQAHFRTSEQGDAQPERSSGFTNPGQTGLRSRSPGAAPQGAGGRQPGNGMASCAEDGNPSLGTAGAGREGRAGQCSQGGVRGGQDKVESTDGWWRKGRSEGEAQRWQERQQQLEERGPQRGHEGQAQGQRAGQEGRLTPGVLDPSGSAADSAGAPPELYVGGDTPMEWCDPATFDWLGQNSTCREDRPLVLVQTSPEPFPPLPPIVHPGWRPQGAVPAPPFLTFQDGKDHHAAAEPAASSSGRKKDGSEISGLFLCELGSEVFHKLWEVKPLRSSSTGRRNSKDIFPLPTSKSLLKTILPQLDDNGIGWMQAVCLSLNTIWGSEDDAEAPLSGAAEECLRLLSKDVGKFSEMSLRLDDFCWIDFFSTRTIDYKGDEVKTARTFNWENIRHALPKEVGKVPLEEVCTLGALHYVQNFDSFIKPPEMWDLGRPPRVMVEDAEWGNVCSGLVESGVCTFLERGEVFAIGEGLLLNGLFGVTKDEWVGDTEVYRLIMNLVPLNGIAHSLRGDVETLPMWSLMNPYFIQPHEKLLISSEDVRCFFYVMSVPMQWWKYLAFNKQIPQGCLPEHLKGREVYLAAKVLPMGFLNSVSLAQHVHRNLSLWSSGHDPDLEGENPPEGEIRKDRALTVKNPSWRIYLDNYDLLERVDSLGVGTLEGTVAPAVLALRQEYEHWEVPRNLKKSVNRQLRAEVQGAQVDGEAGVAYPRESKLVKYLGAALALVQAKLVTQKQLQVVCGGLVYFSMFRRPLLCCLNSIWQFIESFNHGQEVARALPPQCRLEVLRFVALLPLARMDFRVPIHGQVTCSDASSTGGGVCASQGITSWGNLVSQGRLRGELPELRQEHQVLTIGLFDGIGALRVAADLIGVQVIGHISVESNVQAARVVESHFPETRFVSDVLEVEEDMVREWARAYSQASVVLVGGGPPCQGVSGLNADRKGALKDERSRFHSCA